MNEEITIINIIQARFYDMETKDLSHLDTWTGMYNGIFLKIVKHITKYYNKDRWCYYISWNKDRLNPEVFNILIDGVIETRFYYCTYEKSPLYNLYWHGGATYGKLIRNEEGIIHVIEIGCDYSHLWDEGCVYTLDELLHDAKKTIDNFIEEYPNWERK